MKRFISCVVKSLIGFCEDMHSLISEMIPVLAWFLIGVYVKSSTVGLTTTILAIGGASKFYKSAIKRMKTG